MIYYLLIHPVTLTVILVLSIVWLKDLITGGKTLHAIRRTVHSHIKSMGKQDTDNSWNGLSYELKVKLTDQKRLKQGKLFVGSRRVADFAARHSKVYNNGDLIIEVVQKIKRIKGPRQMFVVRLRSRVTGTVRMTVWVNYMPTRQDSWGIQDVCIHPPSGDLGKGDTLTGARITAPQDQPLKGKDKKKGKRGKAKKSAA